MLEPAEGGVRSGAGRAGGRGVRAGGQPGHRPRLRVDLHQGGREARHAAVANKVRASRQGILCPAEAILEERGVTLEG